jgi:hypothetical protein
MNKLPSDSIAAETIARARSLRIVVDTLLIDVDLSHILSVTGTLATTLLLAPIRYEGKTSNLAISGR